MMIVLKCEICDRPAQIIKKTTELAASGEFYMKKVYESVCPCGGVIKPMME